jgi:hypothetical protein
MAKFYDLAVNTCEGESNGTSCNNVVNAGHGQGSLNRRLVDNSPFLAGCTLIVVDTLGGADDNGTSRAKMCFVCLLVGRGRKLSTLWVEKLRETTNQTAKLENCMQAIRKGYPVS